MPAGHSSTHPDKVLVVCTPGDNQMNEVDSSGLDPTCLIDDTCPTYTAGSGRGGGPTTNQIEGGIAIFGGAATTCTEIGAGTGAVPVAVGCCIAAGVLGTACGMVQLFS
jgi:hypothetical protein